MATTIDLSKLGDPAAVARSIEATKAHIRSSRVAPGFDEILLPGETEQRAASERTRAGIEVDTTTWHDIREATATLGITAAEIDCAVGAQGALPPWIPY